MTRAVGSGHSRLCVQLLRLVRHVGDVLSRWKVMSCKRQEVQTPSRTNKGYWRYVRDDEGRGGRDDRGHEMTVKRRGPHLQPEG